MKYSSITSTILSTYIWILHIKEASTLAYHTKASKIVNHENQVHSSTSLSLSLRINTNNINEKDDIYFMRRALSHAFKAHGKTYPNPAVGCVIIQQQDKAIIGEGFHPKAGMPHAEVFALFQAAGLVSNGVEAALHCSGGDLVGKKNSEDNGTLGPVIQGLVSRYCSENGPMELFNDCCSKVKCTAYVTLEPCCHHGKTPPCAMSLKHAGVDRVVIGYPDTNPKVNGGGVKLLQDAGVQVDFINDKSLKLDSLHMIQYFLHRISTDRIPYETFIDSGKKRRVLRSIAGRQKHEKTLKEMSIHIPSNDVMGDSSVWLPSPEWLEEADSNLWQDELLLLRISSSDSTIPTNKRAKVKQTGDTVARELNAYMAQKIGHTILLYRPGKPPVLNFESQ